MMVDNNNDNDDISNNHVASILSSFVCNAVEQCTQQQRQHYDDENENSRLLFQTLQKLLLQQQNDNDNYHQNPHYYDHQHHHQRYLPSSFSEQEGESRGYADDATWILTASFVILTMQSGFGLLEAGSCSPGYEINVMMKNIVDVIFSAFAFYLVGYGIAFGAPANSFMGLGDMPADGGYDEVESGLLYSRYVFQLSFAATATTIVSGCVAMRMKFVVYCLFSFISTILYSFVAHWLNTEIGWLNQMGVHDFAGGASVHIFGGINGLVAILFLGPRKGRFDGSRPISDFFPSSPTSQVFGLFMLWWGWIGFNCGSSFGITDDKWVVATRCAVTTINSTVGGGLLAILYSLWRTNWRLIIPEHVVNGILGSLVAITPGCAYVHTYDAFPIGLIGAFVALSLNTIVCHYKMDDPVGAVGVHAGGGIWGLIAVGFFADSELPGVDVQDGLFRSGGDWSLLGFQTIAVLSTIGWAIAWSSIFFYIVGCYFSWDYTDPRKGLRQSDKEDKLGADWYLHGVINQRVLEDMELETERSDGDNDKDDKDDDEERMNDEEDSNDEDSFDGMAVLPTTTPPKRRRKQLLTRRSDMYFRSSLEGPKRRKSGSNLAFLDHDEQSFSGSFRKYYEKEKSGKSSKFKNTSGRKILYRSDTPTIKEASVEMSDELSNPSDDGYSSSSFEEGQENFNESIIVDHQTRAGTTTNGTRTTNGASHNNDDDFGNRQPHLRRGSVNGMLGLGQSSRHIGNGPRRPSGTAIDSPNLRPQQPQQQQPERAGRENGRRMRRGGLLSRQDHTRNLLEPRIYR